MNCKKFACAIQQCLTDNNYNQLKCIQVEQALAQCCVENSNNPDASAVCTTLWKMNKRVNK